MCLSQFNQSPGKLIRPPSVSVFLGDGAGAFTLATGSPFAVGLSDLLLNDIEVVDFNNDGNRDVVATVSLMEFGRVEVMSGDGAGGLVAAPIFAGDPFRDIEAAIPLMNQAKKLTV